MKCPNCSNDLLSIFRCRYCSKSLCSLQCLEHHFSKFHILKTNPPSKINSPYLIKGFLNSSIYYDNFYSLDNYIPVYDENGKIQIIGSGSYGQVYLAMNILDKKYYAIKHMDKKKLFNLLHSLTSIQKEIDIQSKIDHPNIVKLLYVKETHISYDLVMEYASMGSLFHYIRKYRGLNENKAFSLFIQVVNAVNFMHSNDLIHRDIKPENILLYDNNNIRLCDFGWCVKLDGHQRGTFCGTTEYMSPELVNHEGYGKEIDVWSLGILLYEMIHGYSPFRPNKPKFNEKDVMENIRNHNLIFGKSVSNECKNLIYHLLDSDINKRYCVEDIYNSDFVKKYEKMHFNYPDYNLVQFYNNIINEQNLNNSNNIISKNKENINNINSTKTDINNSNNEYDNNLVYSNNNDYKIQDSRNEPIIYNNYSNINPDTKNITNVDFNRGIYFDYINNDISYNQNLININVDLNKVNNISMLIDNQKNIINSNNDSYKIKKNNNIIPFQNDENHPEYNNIKNNNTYNNNNNKIFVLTKDNDKNNNINISNTNNMDYMNELNNINNNNQYNNISNQPSNNNRINNIIPTGNKLKETNSINYNYFYNFNNYNNNYTNNYFNNSYNQISPSFNIPKKFSSNYNINSLNNSNMNIANKTPSTIATTSNKINQEKKITEFEIGENLSDKEQNDNEHSDIKINVNHEQQKINNRKYLSKSDYSIINKNKKKEKNKNIFIKKLDISDIKLDNTNKCNNSSRLDDNNKDDIVNVELYLLKNKLNKIQKDNNNKIMKTNISNPNLRLKNINNINIKISNLNSDKNQVKSKSFYEKNDIKEEQNRILKKEINKPIKKVDNNNFIDDILCSLFNEFDSQKDKKNEINMMQNDNYTKNNNKYNTNTHKALNTKLSNKEKLEKKIKNNSLIKVEKNNKKVNSNSSFIRIANNNKKINLGLSKLDSCNSEINIKEKNKKINIIRTQPNLSNKENNKNLLNENNKNNKILRHFISTNDINKYNKSKNDNKLKQKKNNKIIEIPMYSKDINIIYKNDKNYDDYSDLNNSKIITPKKRNIFNRVHPFKLLGDFKKELTNYSKESSNYNLK